MDLVVILLLVTGFVVVPITLLIKRQFWPEVPNDFKSNFLAVLLGIAIFWAIVGGPFAYWLSA